MGSLLDLRQLGLGTPLGAEAAVPTACQFLDNIVAGHLMLKVDFQNAFNTVRRDKILLSVLKEVPEIYQLTHAAYSQPSFLFFGDHLLESAEGVQQGDPLGPLLFSLSIHYFNCILFAIRSECILSG